jgi:hypothetical protein
MCACNGRQPHLCNLPPCCPGPLSSQPAGACSSLPRGLIRHVVRQLARLCCCTRHSGPQQPGQAQQLLERLQYATSAVVKSQVLPARQCMGQPSKLIVCNAVSALLNLAASDVPAQAYAVL